MAEGDYRKRQSATLIGFDFGPMPIGGDRQGSLC